MTCLTHDHGRAVLTKAEAATYSSLSIPTLDRYAAMGRGPKRVQLGERRVGYRRADLDAWLEGRVAAPSRATGRCHETSRP